MARKRPSETVRKVQGVRFGKSASASSSSNAFNVNGNNGNVNNNNNANNNAVRPDLIIFVNAEARAFAQYA